MAKAVYIVVFVTLLIFSPRLSAQVGISALEFVENKGQWDPRVQFKAEIGSGAFYLHKDGFTVLLNDTAQYRAILQRIHNGPAISSGIKTDALPAKSYSAEKNTDLSSGSIHAHVYRVSFSGASDAVSMVPEKALIPYNNYFLGNDKNKWATHCRIFQVVNYQNIYPGIDLRYYTEAGHLKYDLVVHPGADPDNIILKYTGIDGLHVKRNQLTIQTSVGDVREMIPQAFQVSKSGNQNVECNYLISGENTVRFKIRNYDPSSILVIDPSLIFSTFTGSRSDNWGYTATYDADGNFYAGGIVLTNDHAGPDGYPTTTGAIQRKFAGGDNSEGSSFQSVVCDVGITKFNSTGTSAVYSTYLGGPGDEQPHSLVVDNAGNLIIAGRTSSGNDFPHVADIEGTGGGFDIFLTKFNATGTALIGSRLYGGTGADGVNYAPKYSSSARGTQSLRLNYGDDGRSEVIVDAANNIYLASCTQSGDFPVVNAVQGASGGGQDGVVIKSDPALSTTLFSTYLGGSGDDAAFVLSINPVDNNLYVAGGTISRNFPGTSNGVSLYNSNQGGADGFVSIYSNNGVMSLIKSTYVGTASTDVIYGIQFDKKGFPYVAGITYGKWPLVNAAYFQTNGKQFIAKLKPDLSAWVYSTMFGKGDQFPDISITAFLVDRCENVYVSGWGGYYLETRDEYNNAETNGLPVTADAMQKTTDGRDFYFMVMKRDAAGQLYGSYFGQNGGLGDHVDGGTSRFDKQGVIYQAICANCYGDGTFTTTANAYARVNGTTIPGGGVIACNLAAVKIAFNFSGVAADLRANVYGIYDTSGCIPLPVQFIDTIKNARKYIWNFGDGTPDSASSTFQVNHTYNAIGTYRIRLIAIDSTTCNISDTAFIDIHARNDKASLAFAFAKLPPCDALKFQFDNHSTAPPGKPFGNTSFTWDFGDGTLLPSGTGNVTHNYLSPGTYRVRLLLTDTNYCNTPDSSRIILNVASLVKAQFQTSPTGCAPYTASFDNLSIGGTQFAWDFGDGGTSADAAGVSHLYGSPGTYTIKLIVTDPNTCNVIDSTSFTIRVFGKPLSAFSAGPVPPVENKPNVFTNNSTGGIRYIWLFGDGDSALRNTQDTVMHQYLGTGTFQACLVTINLAGCPDTVCHPVETLVNPLFDVPNAFTPGRFGNNGIVRVIGFGIVKMDFNIYNRWGKKVFESNSTSKGWDGKFNGELQPMDVYAYTVTVEFFNGKKATKKGDITLIR